MFDLIVCQFPLNVDKLKNTFDYINRLAKLYKTILDVLLM